MQSGGQYGIPDMAQFVVGRTTPHMFTHSQDLSPSPHHRPHAHQLQQQQQHHAPQQPVLPQQHHHHHSQQHHQPQHHHQQTQPQLQPPMNLQQHHNLQKNQPSQQQQLVHQLGLGSDSPEIMSPLASSRASPAQFQPLIPARDPLGDDVVPDEGDKGGPCNRWPREEAIALLRVRSEMDTNFRDSGLKGPLWEEVSRKLAELGYNRSAKKCKEKFENVHKYYKKTKEGRSGRQDGKSYRFFSELEALYAANNNHESGCSGHVGGVSTAEAHDAGAPYLTGNGGSGAAADGIATVHRSDTSSPLNFSSNSSEDDYGEPQENNEHESTKKRKRKSWSSTKAFFENFAKQVMEQQETLHKKFLETIERRDQERVIREETYKMQEMARLNREQELRAQEHALAAARDTALVAFLQKVTGQTLQLPQMPLTPIVTSTPEVQEDLEKDSSDLNTRRWPKTEVHALIRLRSGMEPRFQEAGPKAHLWEEISASMARMGFHRSAKRCKEKWENINKYFRKTKDSCRKRPDNAKTCPYFHQLETLYQKGVLTSPNNRFNNVESHSESLMENGGEDSEQFQGGSAEMLAIVSAGEQCPAATATNMPLGSMRQNGMDGDRLSKKARPVQTLPDSNGSQAAISSLNMERIHDDDGISSSAKSLQVEGFVKEILEMQQQKHQKLLDEYERMEQVREIREQERKRQQEIRLAQELSNSNTQNNAALMALVHKLASDSGEFAMSAPSITD